MFDGNYRASRRRPVNLGSRHSHNRKTTATSSRAAILEASKRQRHERALQQRQQQAAVILQKWIRGAFLARPQCQRHFQQQVFHTSTHQNGDVTLDQTTSMVNFVIRLLGQSSKHAQQQQQQQQSQTIIQLLQVLADKVMASPQKQQQPPEQTTASYFSSSCSSSLIYTKYIWQAVLQDMRMMSTAQHLTLNQQASLLQHALPSKTNIVTQSGLVLLCETLLLSTNDSNNNQQNNNNNNNPAFHILSQYIHTLLQSSTDQQGSRAVMGVLQWTSNASTSQRQPENLMAVLQTWNTYHEAATSTSTPGASLSLLEQVAIQLLLQTTTTTTNTSSSETPTLPVSQRLLRLLHHVLSYTTTTTATATIPATLTVPLVWTVWQQVPLLALATASVARGQADWRQALRTDTTAQSTTANSAHQEALDSDSDSDDDDDDGKVHAKQGPQYQTSAHYSAASGMMLRVTKQDILTTAKLERLMTQTRQLWITNMMQQQQQQQTTQPDNALLLDLIDTIAKLLGKASIWKQWGQSLLAVVESREYDPSQEHHARRAYIWALSVLLQGNHTGLYSRTSAASPFLTQLAFDTTTASVTVNPKSQEPSLSLVDLLWKFVLLRTTNRPTTASLSSRNKPRCDPDENNESILTHHAWSIFCDVYAQQLIALRDNDFLQKHTVPQDAMDTGHSSSRTILAEHVILHLKDALYELYWGRPVLAQEAKYWFLDTMTKDINKNTQENPLTQTDTYGLIPCVAAARTRAFLAGTKLWNSLYERWCRLVRHAPFCDESAWLFPDMITLALGDGVVRQNDSTMNADDDESDDMSIDDEDNVQRDASAQQESETDALAGAFHDPKMARILTSIPQCLPFDRRVKLFHTLLQVDKAKTQDERADMQASMLAMMRGEEFDGGNSRVSVEIHRDNLYHDSMRQLNQLGPKLKKKVKVSFINQHGTAEAGIDGGGVFKEFLDDLIKDAFSPPSTGASGESESTSGLQLFGVTPLETLMVNHHYAKDATFLPHYEFLGRAVGKAVYESILVEPQFCLPFLNTMLGKSNTLEDLKNFDPDYYSSLVKMMAMSRSDIASTGLTFEVNLNNDQELVELVPGGANKNVTKDNVIQYAHLISHRLLNVQTAPQIRAFLRGFRDLIPAAWVRLFAAHELQKVISGDDTVQGIDVSSFQKAIAYAGGYHPSQPVMQDFWEIIHEMTAEQQCKFLKFMTSCSRQPLLGFESLEPVPCIQQVNLPDSLFLKTSSDIAKETPLPTSATCMNLLKLPNYRNKELMRKKLLAAIEAGAGFELS